MHDGRWHMTDQRRTEDLGLSAHLGRGEMWALLSAAAYALNHIFLRIALGAYELNNTVAATVQAAPTLLLTAVLGLWSIRKDRRKASIGHDWKLVGALLGNGLLLFVVATPLLFAAFREGGVLVTSPVVGTQVLWGAGLAALLLRESFNRIMALGMMVSVAGIAVLTLGSSSGANLSATWWMAVPYALGAAFCWALSGVLLRYVMRRGVDRFLALAVIIATGVVTLNILLFAAGDGGLYASTPGSVLVSAVVAGLFSMVALVAITTALSLTNVASASAVNSLQVGLAPILAWVFLSESLNLIMVAGIALILVGVTVVQGSTSVGAGDGR